VLRCHQAPLGMDRRRRSDIPQSQHQRCRLKVNKRMQADQIPPLEVLLDSEFSFGGIGRLILDVLKCGFFVGVELPAGAAGEDAENFVEFSVGGELLRPPCEHLALLVIQTWLPLGNVFADAVAAV
jgi:hypothetical protein